LPHPVVWSCRGRGWHQDSASAASPPSLAVQHQGAAKKSSARARPSTGSVAAAAEAAAGPAGAGGAASGRGSAKASSQRTSMVSGRAVCCAGLCKLQVADSFAHFL
jgi:hypothetical protein